MVLRYGVLYGPGTSLGEGGSIVKAVRQRRVPVVGCGAGVWSFIHVDDASAATLIALERGAPGIYNIVDDDPAPVVSGCRRSPRRSGPGRRGAYPRCALGLPSASTASR